MPRPPPSWKTLPLRRQKETKHTQQKNSVTDTENDSFVSVFSQFSSAECFDSIHSNGNKLERRGSATSEYLDFQLKRKINVIKYVE